MTGLRPIPTAPACWTDPLADAGGPGPGPGPRYIGFPRRSDAARQVSDLIRADIVAHRFSGPLPYEWELLSMYETSRNVLRAALALLKEQRIITRAPRAGTFGVMPVATVSLARTHEDVTVYGDSPAGDGGDSPHLSFVHLTAQLVDAPGTVRRNLEMTDPRAFFVETLISFDGEPSRLRTSWIPHERFPALLDTPLAGNLPDTLARLRGERTEARRLRMSAVNADAWTAELLGVEPGVAIFHFERLACGSDGTPLDYGFSRYRGDRAVVDSFIS
ncbi:GntR family transcriptional regulator [Clavibacter sp. VKM Ac-2542]|uniref:GntR family transcriptional regulator n=1 Tax=Clavibacter sp. VKM Ac-2542 TaxID=2783811 RepID=UPI00188C3166|nr:GntR family transcriptional regulator [Clavibacter sp. VKM Ac-2542]MBF4621165.1 GntR family transcriptional regulator [Clavibacter sp. VKM Ac-2542]